MKPPFLLALDQGTTGTTALLVDSELKKVAVADEDFPQHFPQPGWVEHSPDEIWATVRNTVKKAISGIDPKKIAGIGITNQRETVCFWNKREKKTLGRAIVWQDRRTHPICQELKRKNLEPQFQEATGLLLDPYFSGTKVSWAIQNWNDVKTAYEKNELAVGTIDSYLCFKLSGGNAHVTEPSNASRTLCYHIEKHEFDPHLSQALGIRSDIWPEVNPSVGTFCKTEGLDFLPDGIPVTGILGDQQSALLGQACLREGDVKCTYGTGAFILLNTGKKIIRSKHRLLTTIAWAMNDKDYTYALEGSAFVAGAAVQWLRDGMKLINKASEIEALAKEVSTTDGVYFVPALTGIGAPYWEPRATGTVTGITRGTTRAHLARAALEGIALQNADLLVAMQNDLGRSINALNVDGGASANGLLMQMQSDFLGTKLRRPQFTETTSLGAIFAAGLGAKVWNSIQDIEKTWKLDREFTPQIDQSARAAKIKEWHLAVSRSLLMTSSIP